MLILVLMLFLALAGDAQAASPGANGQIAFVKSGDIWVMGADGGGQHAIVDTAGGTASGPAFSPEGDRIAYVDATQVKVALPTGLAPSRSGRPATATTWRSRAGRRGRSCSSPAGGATCCAASSRRARGSAARSC